MRDDGKKTLIKSIVLLFLFLTIVFILNVYSNTDISVKKSKNVYYKNYNPIDIESIVINNTKDIKAEKIIIEEMDIDYKTLYKENASLPEGNFRVTQLGEYGKQDVVLKQSYVNAELKDEKIVSNNVIKNSVEKIIEIGTGKGYLDPEIEEGDTVFVSANNLKFKQYKSYDSENIGTIEYNTEIEVIGVDDNWVEVEVEGIHGFVVKEGVSKFDINKDYTVSIGTNSEFSKEELLSRLSYDMDVSVQSGLSLEQFEGIFENNSYDTAGVLKDNAKYFYYAEEQYNINGVFLAAIAVHESAWGTSTIARNKNNLFGYCAYDATPYESATSFENVSEGIDLVARVLTKNYLNPQGTELPDGTTATGRYHTGNTIKSVNVHYATDPNWANCVYTWMERLYNAIPE